jgi:hypothetical protein
MASKSSFLKVVKKWGASVEYGPGQVEVFAPAGKKWNEGCSMLLGLFQDSEWKSKASDVYDDLIERMCLGLMI